MKKILFSALALMIPFFGMSQDKIVSFDYQNNIFNNHQALPENEYFTLQGTMPANVNMVQVLIYKNRKSEKPLYNYTWNRPLGNKSQSFNIPVTHKLRQNSEYDIVINYYSPLDNTGKVALKQAIRENLTAYLDAAIDVDNKRMSLSSNAVYMVKDMSKIVEGALTYYQNALPGQFIGFSDIIVNQLKAANSVKAKDVAHQFNPNANAGNEWSKYSKAVEKNIIDAAMHEVDPYLEGQMNILVDQRIVSQYPTEKSFNTIALNVGYGATYFSGGFSDLDYAHAPYIGLSFPLGNYNRSKFLGNASVSIGVFLKNFQTADGVDLTGPIFGRPYFLGVGYKFLHIFRAQVGAVALSTTQNNNGLNLNLNTSEMYVRPFVGLSAEINLWMGFDRKKK